ncbi:hypothetical protein [Streptomyces sp. NPDC050395]|uniref:hypothetical protein n=1 Tax=Streptomyces sp. NPDC050395 TaxID=3155401 RepID=UPI003440077E
MYGARYGRAWWLFGCGKALAAPQVAAFVLASLPIVGGFVLIFLLVVSESSRSLGTPDELDENEFGEDEGDEVAVRPSS